MRRQSAARFQPDFLAPPYRVAQMLSLSQMTDGWEAHECNDPDDVWRVFDRNRRQVFIADDAFGSTQYRRDAAERWARGWGDF